MERRNLYNIFFWTTIYLTFSMQRTYICSYKGSRYRSTLMSFSFLSLGNTIFFLFGSTNFSNKIIFNKSPKTRYWQKLLLNFWNLSVAKIGIPKISLLLNRITRDMIKRRKLPYAVQLRFIIFVLKFCKEIVGCR